MAMLMKIIPGLPDDIGRECLWRASLFSRDAMAGVCKTWKNIVCSPLFYQDRKRSGLSQQLIILTCYDERGCRIKLYDPLQQSYETLPRCRFYFSDCLYCLPCDHKLFVLGLRSNFTNDDELLIYNFVSGKWKRGPKLPDFRFGFCSSVDSAKGLIYIADGCDRYRNGLRRAAVYDIEEEKWEYLPPMIWSGYGSRCHSVFTDDKLYVVSRAKGQVQIYDPNSRQWSAINISFDGSNMQPSFCLLERIYLENHFHRAGIPRPSFLGATMWNGKILVGVLDKEEKRVFYLIEPSIEGEAGGKEEKLTLFFTLPKSELPDTITSIAAVAL